MLNKIYNEDCMIGIKKIPYNFIDLVIIDPPYQINNHNVKYDSDLARSINSYNDELYKSNLTTIPSPFILATVPTWFFLCILVSLGSRHKILSPTSSLLSKLSFIILTPHYSL